MLTGGRRRTTATSRASTALPRRTVDKQGALGIPRRSSHLPGAGSPSLHLGQGLSRHRPPTSQCTGGAAACLTRGDYKSGGSREVTKLLDSKSPGKLPDGLALEWSLPYFLRRNIKAPQVALVVKNPSANAGDVEMRVPSLGREDALEEAWQPTPAFSPGESHGQRSLAGCSLLLPFSRV